MRKRFSAKNSRQVSNRLQTYFYALIASLRWGLLIFVSLMLCGAVGMLGWEIWSSWRHSLWNGERQFTLVYESNNQLGYIRFNPQLGEVKRFSFPDNAMIFLAQGYESFQADKIKLLADQEKIPLGPLLQKSMTIYLGSMTDGYITQYAQANPDVSTLLWRTLFKQTQTNMSTWDVIRLLWFLQSLDAGDIVELEFTQTQVMRLTTLADGTEVYETDANQLDTFAIKELADPLFLAQPLSWEIFNTTEHTGLGEQMARIIRNSGFDVVGIRQATEVDPQPYSKIQVRDRIVVSDTINILATFFGFALERGDDRTNRADVAIVLGEDFWQWGFSRQD